ncbi:heparin-sulfate lyase HepC [uncultured Bacteroides sp.]|uniref:heparin-sulfate lyase HepC n=1 Tax=uncultured Bacteroides sp. TaxID=162156 RepID=UPI0025F1601E|nr:heparin-sulfate lyase HepC [uncultured Bacteroides sp.]
MKNTLFICLFALFAFSGCVDDEEDFATGGNISPELTPENKENAELNAAIFDQLNLDYPGLEKVKQYYEAGENYLAASALLEYYRTRTNVENPNLSLVDVTYTDADKSKADYALEYRFYVNGQLENADTGLPYSVGKAGAINWTITPKGTNAEYQKQLHRHQWFIPQAKVYRTTRDEKYINSWIEVYSDWIAQNPKPEAGPTDEGPWWQLQAATRVLDQVQLLDYYKISSNFTPEWLTTFLASFSEHADFLAAYPYRDGNILVTQANALATAGILMPEFKNAETWKNEGYKILNTQIEQFLADGWHKEFSLHYHIAAIADFNEAMKLANANNMAVDFKESLRKAAEVVMHFTYPNYFAAGTSKGTPAEIDQIVPMFNDSWNRGRSTMTNNFKLYASMFPDSEEFKYMATAGNNGAAQGKTPGNEMKLFEDAGFYILRNGWEPSSTVMIFSNNKFNDVSNSLKSWSHNQADNGTFELYINKRNFFPDSGVYTYESTDKEIQEFRYWFRGIDKHNTLSLGNKNITKAEGKLLKAESKNNTETLVFENQGYDDMKHRRAVFYVNKSFFVLVDEGIGAATGSANLSFNLCRNTEDVEYDADKMGAHTTFADGNNIVVRTFPVDDFTFEGFTGRVAFDSKPATGYDERKSYRIKKQKAADETVRFITVILPCGDTNAQDIEAEFTDEGYNANGASVKVTINGSAYNLSYTL